jgi:hypothetical protein
VLALLPAGILVAGSRGAETFPVSIVASANPADAGLPFELVATVVAPNPLLVYNWTNSLGESSSGSSWELTDDVPGNLSITLEVTDLLGGNGAATLTVALQPPPSLNLSSPLAQVDAGVPAPFFIHIRGGVPPFTVNWTPTAGGPSGNASWPLDGNYSEEVNFSVPGPGWVAARAVDSLGDPASTGQVITEVEPRGSISFAANGSVTEVGRPLTIAAAVEEGAPPFHWSLYSSLPLSDTSTFGLFPTDGTFQWNVSFAFPGVAFLNLTAIDATGAFLVATTAVLVEPSLSVELTSPNVQPISPFEVDANLSGGLAPYSYAFQLSDGEEYTATLASPGPVSATFDPTPGGNYSLVIRITDALGQTRSAAELVRVVGARLPAPDPPASNRTTGTDTPLDTGILILIVIVLVTGVYAFYRYRRVPRPRALPENSALTSVRQLMQQSQIIDRETLLLLCEEAGESAEAAQAAVQTLIRTGEVRTEPGPANDEVLRWNPADRPNVSVGDFP